MKYIRKFTVVVLILSMFITSVSLAYCNETDAITPIANTVEQPEKVVAATPTASKVLVDGKTISFNAYLINGNNYFKLRDLALAVSGTSKQFEVTWDESVRSISLILNAPYTVVGGELSGGDGQITEGILSDASIYVNGSATDLTAYMIGGNNYFKLRDVAAAIDLGITYNEETKNIGIETDKSYEVN